MRYDISIESGIYDDKPLYEARVKQLTDIVVYSETYYDVMEAALDAITVTHVKKHGDIRFMAYGPYDSKDRAAGFIRRRHPELLNREWD